MFTFELLLQEKNHQIRQNDLYEQALNELKTTSLTKFEIHLKEPIEHKVLVKTVRENITVIKSPLSASQMKAILEKYQPMRNKDEMDEEF